MQIVGHNFFLIPLSLIESLFLSFFIFSTQDFGDSYLGGCLSMVTASTATRVCHVLRYLWEAVLRTLAYLFGCPSHVGLSKPEPFPICLLHRHVYD